MTQALVLLSPNRHFGHKQIYFLIFIWKGQFKNDVGGNCEVRFCSINFDLVSTIKIFWYNYKFDNVHIKFKIKDSFGCYCSYVKMLKLLENASTDEYVVYIYVVAKVESKDWLPSW